MNFLAALEADRAELNQRFKVISHQGSPLDGQAFNEHLIKRVEPIVSAVASVYPERVRPTTRELFEVSLQLFRAGYWAGQSRLPELSRLWEVVLPKLGKLVAREPERVSGSLSNALINLAIYPVRLQEWLDELASRAQECDSVSQLLEVASVLAWRTGLVLLRKRSLELLAQLPRGLAARTLGLPNSLDEAQWQDLLTRMEHDRWFNPAQQREADRPAIVEQRRVANYRGLGGSLLDLPQVFRHESGLYVTDQTSSWRIQADCFGCILQSAELPSPSATSGASPSPTASIQPDGNVSWHGHQQTFDYLARSTSQACDGQTLAVTLPDSFHVYLLTCLPAGEVQQHG